MKDYPKEKNHLTPPLDNITTLPDDVKEKLKSNKAIRAKLASFKVYSHCVVFTPAKINNPENPHERRPRGKITEFSKRSRFRLFELLAQIDDKLDFKPLFVSLTYHYGHENSTKSTKSQLHNFLTQLRQFDSGVEFIWRTELQSRGAPHYHLIIFPGPIKEDIYKDNYEIRISQIWHSIADPKSYKHKDYGCKITVITSYREGCIYISKYVAKEELNNSAAIEGKHWGCSRNLPIKVYHEYRSWNDDSHLLIVLIRDWMWKVGKEKYANPDYVNEYHPFTVFIDRNVFNALIPDDLVYIEPGPP